MLSSPFGGKDVMAIKLRVLHGKNAGHEIRLKEPKFLIGRGEDCQLRPKSESISRHHCEFSISGNDVTLSDLGSKNGTFVNGEVIEGPTRLSQSDEIRVGKLAFEIVGLEIETPAPAVANPAVTNPAVANPAVANPAVANKEKPAAMFADEAIEDSDISAWLQEGDDSTRARELAEPETKQFRLETTDRDALVAAPAETEEAESDSEDTDEDSTVSDDSSAENKKKKFGKLPSKLPVNSTDSREAASDMLKKFFNRR